MIPRHSTHRSTGKTAANLRHHSFHGFHGTLRMRANVCRDLYLYWVVFLYVRILMPFLLWLSRIYNSPWNAWYQWNTGLIGRKSVKTAVESQWKPENVS